MKLTSWGAGGIEFYILHLRYIKPPPVDIVAGVHKYRAPNCPGCVVATNSFYLGTTLTDQNSIREETKRRLNLGNACYYSVQNHLSSSLLSKKLKIKIYRTIILPVVLYGCETWSLTLREERRLRVFENRVLRRIFGPKRDEVTGE